VPESGWYPDPRGAARTYRWWDGERWTADLTDDPTDAPPPTPDEVPPAVLAPAEPAVVPVRIDPAQTSAYQRPPRSAGPTRVARPDRVVAVVALVVVLVAVSLVVVLRADGTGRSAPLLAPPAPEPTRAVVGYDPGSRQARVGDVVATFPGAPWTAKLHDPYELAGLVSACVVGSVVVHPAYNGTDDWSASLLLGRLDPAIVRPGDGTATVRAVLAYVRTTYYSDVPTTVANATPSTVTAAPGRPVARLQADLRYAVPKLSSRSDRVTILVIAPPTGSAEPPVVWVSLRPEDTPKATTDALSAALNTLKLA
jgi:hypothetical protein